MKSPVPVCELFHRPGHAGLWAQLLHAMSLSLLGGRPKASPLPCGQGNTPSTEPENQYQFEETGTSCQTGPCDLPNPAEEICEIHRYTKNFLCKVTKDVWRLLCCVSEQQGAPRHGSLQWTAEEYQVSNG